LLVLFGLPNASSKLMFAVLFVIVGFVEASSWWRHQRLFGTSPRNWVGLRRWVSGPWGRSSAVLVLSEVSSHTLGSLPAWQDQFTICGIVGLAVFVIALFTCASCRRTCATS